MTKSDTNTNGIDRRWAEEEYEFYKQHGRPSGPYYMKCFRCNEIWEINGTLLDANHDTRRHAGVHSDIREEHAEVVVTDRTGREAFRHHAIHAPYQEPKKCPDCDSTLNARGARSCPQCGFIPKESRA